MVGKRLWTIIIALIFLVACVNGKDREDSSAIEEQRETPPESTQIDGSTVEPASYEAIEVESAVAGAVQGVIRLSGPAPVPDLILLSSATSIGTPTQISSSRIGMTTMSRCCWEMGMEAFKAR